MPIDPYTPPKPEPIQQQESPKPSQQTTLFGFQGRITRRTFLIYSTTALVPLWGLMIILDQLIFPLTYYGASVSSPTSRNPIGTLLLLVLGIPAFWIALALQVKRWHDHSKSAWWLLIWLTPLGILWVPIELGLVRGSPFPNKYGRDPLRDKKLS